MSGVLQPLTLGLYSHPWVFGSRSSPALEFVFLRSPTLINYASSLFPVETDPLSPLPLADALQEWLVLGYKLYRSWDYTTRKKSRLPRKPGEEPGVFLALFSSRARLPALCKHGRYSISESQQNREA